MKILWACNVPLPGIAEDMGINVQHICGWLVGFANCLEREEDIDFAYAFSQPKLLGFISTEDPIHESDL